ncbi:MAG: M55 family metallopeptidase [Verrucomicrobiae bacterium]|nr:M55 family metallopeptidase [Verrucomicrobiae bacterium]
MNKIIFSITDMEGLSDVDRYEQCYGPRGQPDYEHGRVQLTEDTNAAIAGAFDAGATEVRVLDGHGYNQNQGFRRDLLDPRATLVWFAGVDPTRFEGFDESVAAVMMVGQHSMAGTPGAFLAHTQFLPTHLKRYRVNGVEYGELGQCALFASDYGVPLIYLTGDDAACAEAKRQFPWVVTTPVKHGTGWETCELFPTDKVRAQIRADVARAVRSIRSAQIFKLPIPLEIMIDWVKTEHADQFAGIRGVQRPAPCTTRWRITQARDIYSWPGKRWQPNG